MINRNQNTDNEVRLTGKVIKKTIGDYFVAVDGRVVGCSISTKLRKKLVYPEADPASRRYAVDEVRNIDAVAPVAVGDDVVILDIGDGSGRIVEVLERNNKLSRLANLRGSGSRSAYNEVTEQVIISNVDRAVIVFSAAKPKSKWQMLDRYLVSIEMAGIPALICVNKTDLVDEDSIRDEMARYGEIGYRILFTSGLTGRGVDELKDTLADKTSVLLGKSGVGKTTLLNAVQPGLGLAVTEVNEKYGKGRHTTSNLEMFSLDCGGYVVDTPGMREFALWESNNTDIAYCFPEMRPYLGECKFGADCTHSHEPDCAVKEAVEAGEINEQRYKSYLKLI
ncbi:MAG: ribosome small subunit-dependent GTPase A [bacterium]|nr:ribosome small subunit-dependent GTPase A [bacterium]